MVFQRTQSKLKLNLALISGHYKKEKHYIENNCFSNYM